MNSPSAAHSTDLDGRCKSTFPLLFFSSRLASYLTWKFSKKCIPGTLLQCHSSCVDYFSKTRHEKKCLSMLQTLFPSLFSVFSSFFFISEFSSRIQNVWHRIVTGIYADRSGWTKQKFLFIDISEFYMVVWKKNAVYFYVLYFTLYTVRVGFLLYFFSFSALEEDFFIALDKFPCLVLFSFF